MHLCEQRVEAYVHRTLGISATVGVAPLQVPAELDLTTQEQQQYDKVRGTPRSSSWLAGRAALKQVLRNLGEPIDTSDLMFPHARVSLTHSAGHAVALGVPKGLRILGIGVDLETIKQLRPQGDRFFLAITECDWIRSSSPHAQAGDRLRLWTVKEALFKANPKNEGTMLRDYCLIHPSAHTGIGILQFNPAVSFFYSSMYFAEGILSVAISQTREVLT